MKKLLCITAAILLGISLTPPVEAQTTDSTTYKEPAWLFPVWFKNAFGEVDTVWIGHDNLATPYLDTLFKEILIPLDSSVFSARVGSSSNEDTILKYSIKKYSNENFYLIKFHKGYKPLTMYWDKTLFYSDSLPYPDLDSLPRARGELFCNNGNPLYLNCPTNFPIVMTDNPDSLPGFMPFVQTDSIFFDGLGDGIDEQGDLLLYIYPYDYWVGVKKEKDNDKSLKLYPNPSEKFITLELENNFDFSYSIYNLFGVSIITDEKSHSNKTEINIEHLPRGIYFLKLLSGNEVITRKFIKN